MNRVSISVLLLSIALPNSGTFAQNDDIDLLTRFQNHVSDNDALTSQQLGDVEQIASEYADSPADAITESLILIHDGYGQAIESSDGSDTADAVQQLGTYSESDDRWLAADASYYLGRFLMNGEQYELAIPLLQRVTGELAEFSAHEGSAQFYIGVAQAGLLQYAEAARSLTEFLQFHPDAPERLRVAAWRQVQQLRSIKTGQLEDVYQRMDFSRRRLSLIEPGDRTQEQQQKIVNMLARLIREQEKKEASSQSQDQQQQQQQQQQQKQQQAQKNQQQSKSQTGGKSNNPNGQVVRKSYDDGPSSPWSRLRDRSRDPANNAIKDKLPARYRDIVERYYEQANRESNK